MIISCLILWILWRSYLLFLVCFTQKDICTKVRVFRGVVFISNCIDDNIRYVTVYLRSGFDVMVESNELILSLTSSSMTAHFSWCYAHHLGSSGDAMTNNKRLIKRNWDQTSCSMCSYTLNLTLGKWKLLHASAVTVGKHRICNNIRSHWSIRVCMIIC